MGITESTDLDRMGQPTSWYQTNNMANGDEGDDLLKVAYKAIVITLKYKFIILILMIISSALGFLYNKISIPIYQTSATAQIDKQGAKVIDVEGVQAVEGNDRFFYATQYELILSRAMASEVVSKQNLASNLNFLNSRTRVSLYHSVRVIMGLDRRILDLDSVPLEVRVQRAVDKVQQGLSVEAVGASRIFRVSYKNTNPEIASVVANAVVDTFIISSLDRRFDASAYARKFLEERLTEVRLRLEESEAQLVQYGREASIINVDNQGKGIASSGLEAERSALLEVKRLRLARELRWQLASKADDNALSLMADAALISTLRSKQAELVAEYESKLDQFKPGYPEMQRLSGRIAEFGSRISSEAKLVRESIRNDFLVALEQEKQLNRNLTRIKSEVLDFEDRNIKYKILKREVDTNTVLYEGLLQRYKEVGVSAGGGDNNISVVDISRIPSAPVSPVFLLNLLISLVLGGIVSSVVVFCLHVLRDKVDNAADLESVIFIPSLGAIPAMKIDSVGAHCADQPRSALSEAVRSLRTSLQFSTSNGLPKSLLMTSTRSGEGKSSLSAGLGISFAQLGMRVLLIDADLRDPSLSSEIWGTDNALREDDQGLSNFLSSVVAWDSVAASTHFEGLKFIPTGPLPPNPAELLAGPRFSELLLAVKNEFDIVIIDGPPVLELADAPSMSSIANATLMVLAAGETRRRAVVAAVARLRSANARIIGFVLNKTKRGGLSYGYGYGYGDGYSYGGGKD